jgi:putative ABC transport system permease protein
MELTRLVWRNLMRRKLRTLLTVGSLVIALFLMCLLRTLVTTLQTGAATASSSRLIVQSAVSLFVDLPLSYQPKIETVPGIDNVLKWQWFGGYYKDPKNFFAQFAADAEKTFEVYPEMQIVGGSKEAFLANRRGCLIGERLAHDYGWKIGDTVPILPTIFPHPDGPEVAWEFEVEAIYHPTERYFDAGMLLFHWDYFEKTVEAASQGEAPGVGTYILHTPRGTDQTAVMAAVDQLFENGPQRVQTTSEAEFQQQFISMMGNVPFFVSTIGGAVLVAILLAVVNTMLMSGREQTRDLGIMKALGFSDGAARALLVSQSLALCIIGGGLGLLAVRLMEPAIATGMGAQFPGFHVLQSTFLLGAIITVGLGIVAGIVPAWRAGKLRPVEALGAEQ